MRLVLVALLALSVFMVGCPKERRALDVARKAVEATAQTVDLIDAEAAALYTAAAGEALAACDTRPCYASAMRKWNKTVLAVNSMKLSLLVVENALDAWAAGSPNGQNNLLGAAACFFDSMVDLHILLAELDAPAPVLEQGLDYVRNLFGTSGYACPVGA